MTVELNCPVCGSGHLERHTQQEIIEYKKAKLTVDLSFSICDVCGVEQASDDDLRQNKRACNAAKKRFDGLLTGSEVRIIREEHFKITQGEAAEIFGGGPVAFSKYESDDVVQSEAMDKLLRVSYSVPQALKWLKDYSTGEDLESLVERILDTGIQSVIFKSLKSSSTAETFNPEVISNFKEFDRFYNVKKISGSSVYAKYIDTSHLDDNYAKFNSNKDNDVTVQLAFG